MAIGHVVTRGFGNGTLTGNIGEVATRGYTPDSVVVPNREGMEFTMPESRLHFTMDEARLQYTLPECRLHYTLEKDDG